MKQTFLLFCCFLIVIGCGDQKNNKEINEFKNALGTGNVLELDNYILAFENNFLKGKYPNAELQDAYRKITSESIENLKQAFNQYFDEQNRKRFLDSQLWNEIYAPADSVWIEDDEFVIQFVYKSADGVNPVSMTGERLPKPKDRDSLKVELLKWVDFNKDGKYLNALIKVKNHNKFLKDYVKTKSTFGVITPGAFQYLIDINKPDLNDYLNRRIIAIELSEVLHNFRE